MKPPAILSSCNLHCVSTIPLSDASLPRKGATSSIVTTYSGPNRSNSSCCFYICPAVIWHSPRWWATTLSITWKGDITVTWSGRFDPPVLPSRFPSRKRVSLSQTALQLVSFALCHPWANEKETGRGACSTKAGQGTRQKYYPKKRNWFIASVSPCQKLFLCRARLFFSSDKWW